MATTAPTIAGATTTIQWGTDATGITNGIITSMTKGSGGEQKEYKDYQGAVVTLVTYDKHDTIQLTALITAASYTIPKKGETFTVGGVTYYVTDASVNWSNEDAASVSLSGRTYPEFS